MAEEVLYSGEWLATEEQWSSIDEQWISGEMAREILEWLTNDLQWTSQDAQWLSEDLDISTDEWLAEDGQWTARELQWLSETETVQQEEWISGVEQWASTEKQWIGREAEETEKGGSVLISYFSAAQFEAHAWQNVSSLDSSFNAAELESVAYTQNYLLPITVLYNNFGFSLTASFVKTYTADLEFRAPTLEASRTAAWTCDASFAKPTLTAGFTSRGDLDQEFAAPTVDIQLGASADLTYARPILDDSWLKQDSSLIEGFFTAKIGALVGVSLNESFPAAEFEASFQNMLSLNAEMSAATIEATTSPRLDTVTVAPTLDGRLKEDFCLDAVFQAPEFLGYAHLIGPGFEGDIIGEFAAPVLEEASFGMIMDAEIRQSALVYGEMRHAHEFSILKYEEEV